MQYVPAPNVVACEFIFNLDGAICEFTLHYLNPGAMSVPEMVALGDALVAWFNTSLKSICPSTMTLVDMKVTDLTTAEAPSIHTTVGLPVVGTAVSPQLPNHCALVLTKRSLLRGRSRRGRIYWLGLQEGQVTGNIVAASLVTSLITAFNTRVAFTVGTVAWKMVIVSKFTAGNPRAIALVTDVNGFSSDGVIDSQRRRLPGRGA